MLAAIEGNKEMVSTLLKHKASVTAKDKDEQTALYHAVSNGNYEVTKLLALQPHSDINTKNRVSEGGREVRKGGREVRKGGSEGGTGGRDGG